MTFHTWPHSSSNLIHRVVLPPELSCSSSSVDCNRKEMKSFISADDHWKIKRFVSVYTLQPLDPAWAFYLNVNHSIQYQYTAAAFRDSRVRNQKSHGSFILSYSFFLISCARVSPASERVVTFHPKHTSRISLFTLLFFSHPARKWQKIAITEDEMGAGGADPLSLSSTVLLQTQETFSMLLLFNTHVGGSLTDYSFKSHLSVGHQTSFKLIKIMGGIKKHKQAWRNTWGMRFYTWVWLWWFLVHSWCELWFEKERGQFSL